MAFKPISSLLGKTLPKATPPDAKASRRHSTYHQEKGSKIANEFNDRKNTSLYIFWCMWYEDSIIETARRQTHRGMECGTVKEPRKYFTERLEALGGKLPKEAYANRRKKKINPQLKFKLL